MDLRLIGADPLGGPAMVWVDYDTGDIVMKGLKALPEDVPAPGFPGTETLELPDRMKPIILKALDVAQSLGFDPDR